MNGKTIDEFASMVANKPPEEIVSLIEAEYPDGVITLTMSDAITAEEPAPAPLPPSMRKVPAINMNDKIREAAVKNFRPGL